MRKWKLREIPQDEPLPISYIRGAVLTGGAIGMILITLMVLL